MKTIRNLIQDKNLLDMSDLMAPFSGKALRIKRSTDGELEGELLGLLDAFSETEEFAGSDACIE